MIEQAQDTLKRKAFEPSGVDLAYTNTKARQAADHLRTPLGNASIGSQRSCAAPEDVPPALTAQQ